MTHAMIMKPRLGPSGQGHSDIAGDTDGGTSVSGGRGTVAGTLLGVILAVTTLVVVMSVVSGMNFYVADRVANLGANVFIVDRFGIITSQDAWVKAQKRPLVTMEDYERLRDNMKSARAVAAPRNQIDKPYLIDFAEVRRVSPI